MTVELRCVICNGPYQYALRDKVVCQPCARAISNAYRKNKQLREANEHGVYSLGSPLIAMRPDSARRA